MSALAIWIVIVGMTAITFATRSAFLVLGERYALPERVQHGLRYAPACALVALITPELALVDGAFTLSLANPKLVAGIVAGALMITTRSVVMAMALGMLAFTGLRLLTG